MLHGLSQERLARELDLDESTIRGWEREAHQPWKKNLVVLERLLGVARTPQP